VRNIELIEGRPEYLRIFAVTYIIGLGWERLVNHFDALESLRCVLIFELERT
jgi:hypothetical protein